MAVTCRIRELFINNFLAFQVTKLTLVPKMTETGFD